MFVPVEEDAITRVQKVATLVSDIPRQFILGGLTELWAWCMKEERETVTQDQLRGCFGTLTDDLLPSLVAFEFLEVIEGGYKVRGTSRYTKLREARRRGGLASKDNLRQFRTGSTGSTRSTQPVETASTREYAVKQLRLTSPEPGAAGPAKHRHPPATEEVDLDQDQNLLQKHGVGPDGPALIKPQERVFRNYLAVTGQDPSLPMSRDDWSILGKAFKLGFTEEQLIAAAAGVAVDWRRWPERRGQMTLRVVYGTADQIRKFLALSPQGFQNGHQSNEQEPGRPEEPPKPLEAPKGQIWSSTWSNLRDRGFSPDVLRLLAKFEQLGDNPGHLVLRAPDERAADWVRDNYGPVIEEVSKLTLVLRVPQ